MWTRYDLKLRGKQAFQRNYWSAVAVALVVLIIDGYFSSRRVNRVRGYLAGETTFPPFSILGLIIASFVAIAGIVLILLKIFVGNVLLVGGHHFFVVNQKDMPTASMLAHGFKCGNYGNIVLTMFLRDLFVSLWTLLFVIPGIIKRYEYLMIPYILGENPGMRREEAFLISKNMMMGQKWEAFILDLSFIGWWILAVMSLGVVGVFYVGPYHRATFAELYAVNREIAYEKGYIR